MVYQFTLTEEETKTRKTWLFLSILIFVWPIFLALIDFFFSERILFNMVQVAFSVIINAGLLYTFYYCAYKHHGTGLLTFSLILGLIFLLSPILDEKSSVSNTRERVDLTYSNVYRNLTIIFELFWLFYSFKLRKVNLSIQIQILLASDEYKRAVASIQAADKLEDLTFIFHDAIREWPEHFAKILKEEYNKKKFLLEEIHM